MSMNESIFQSIWTEFFQLFQGNITEHSSVKWATARSRRCSLKYLHKRETEILLRRSIFWSHTKLTSFEQKYTVLMEGSRTNRKIRAFSIDAAALKYTHCTIEQLLNRRSSFIILFQARLEQRYQNGRHILLFRELDRYGGRYDRVNFF